jgi:hypothetical protein
MMLHKVYVGASSCSGNDDFSYTSPFGCYNPKTYDGIEQYDTYDELLDFSRDGRPTKFRRTYYYSQDGSCQDKIEGSWKEKTLWGSSWETLYQEMAIQYLWKSR